ncbi:hypothetical protein F4819DRAFT_464727 [Hypoxylon fuscum]|nr:hypothetical protein F4819DRAFT_464727 [Hypoxylon fuscum]
MGREIMTLAEIEQLRRASSIRIPRLRGLVKHPETEAILGYLRDIILSGVGRTLADLEVSETLRQRRVRWAEQITETVERLHKAGIVWGEGRQKKCYY